MDLRKRVHSDFAFGKILGEGSYSTVMLATEISTGSLFAIKMLDKRQLMKENKVKYVTIEKEVLNALDSQYIVKLFYTFQDTYSLYFALEFAQNGDMLAYIRERGRLGIEAAVFYSAQILLGIEHMHSKSIIHRDIKPENILLDFRNHAKITDFGTAKILTPGSTFLESNDGTFQKKKGSFVGTAEYCSPEILNDKNASFASDIWALGCVLFHFVVGRPPFKGANEYQTFQKIIKLDFIIPPEVTEASTQLISRILVNDATERPNIKEIKLMPFFLDLEWNSLNLQDAPLIPEGALLPYGKADSFLEIANRFDSFEFDDEPEQLYSDIEVVDE